MEFASTLIIYTIVMVIGWVFYALINLQTRRYIGYSRFLPVISQSLLWSLIALTILGYSLIFIYLYDSGGGAAIPRPSGSGDNFTF